MTRLILYNIQYLEGTSGKKSSYLKFWRRLIPPKDIDKKVAEQLKTYNPDIVSLIEVGSDSVASREKHIDNIKKELKLKHSLAKTKYEFKGPYGILKLIPFLNHQGNTILSKRKISSYHTDYFKEGFKKSVMISEINLSKKLALILVHLALGKNTRKKQLSEIAEIVNKIKTPVILMGDFNTFSGEREIKSLLKETKLKHKFNLGGGRIYTYPSFHPKKIFDYILTSPEINVKKYEVLKTELSDHLPILVDFEVK